MKKNLIILILSFILFSCNSNKKEETKKVSENSNIVHLSNKQLKNITVEFGFLEKKTLSTLLRLNGLIDIIFCGGTSI